jgi:transposase
MGEVIPIGLDIAKSVFQVHGVGRTLREQIGLLHDLLLAIVRTDDVCRRLMTVPGVGPVVVESHDGRAVAPIPKRSTSPRATSTLQRRMV